MAYENKKEPPLNDNSLMPTGKHKGEKMINVPASYLWYIYDNEMCNDRVRTYIQDNLAAIKFQLSEEKIAWKADNKKEE